MSSHHVLALRAPSASVLEDFFPEEIWNPLWAFFRDRASFRYGWPSDKSVSEFMHWHLDFLNTPRRSGNGRGGFVAPIQEEVSAAWQYLSSTVMKGHRLVRCYANAHTYGVEGYVHTDALENGNFTALVYLVPEWKPEWAGETTFHSDDGEIAQAVLPKGNRLIIFEGQRLHAARALSRECPGLRITLMFKTLAPAVTLIAPA